MCGRTRLGFVLLAASAVLAGSLLRSGANLNLPAPVMGALAPTPTAAPSTAPHPLLFVVIDGLRADEAHKLPFLGELARRGAHARLWADPPTYSAAQYVSLLSGVPPRDSGIRTNEALRAAALDDVAARARAGGQRTVALSTHVDWWQRLYPRSFEEAAVLPAGEILAALRARPATGFALVHLCEVDEAGHTFGARSRAYEDAAAAADRTLAAMAEAWGWPKATVAVVADHGHRERGGHGGDEPDVRESFFVASGPGIAPGADGGDARSVDVAPTLAALLGTGAPAQASGRTLAAMLDVPEAVRAGLRAIDDRRLVRVAADLADARAPLARAERRGRVLRSIPGLAFVVLAVAAGRRRPRSAARGVVGLLAAIAAFTLIFGPVSFSAARRAPLWAAGMAVLTFAGAMVCLRLPRTSRADAADVAAVVAGFSPLALVAFVHSGLFATRLTCEPAWVAAFPPFAFSAIGGACLAAAFHVFASARRSGTGRQ